MCEIKKMKLFPEVDSIQHTLYEFPLSPIASPFLPLPPPTYHHGAVVPSSECLQGGSIRRRPVPSSPEEGSPEHLQPCEKGKEARGRRKGKEKGEGGRREEGKEGGGKGKEGGGRGREEGGEGGRREGKKGGGRGRQNYI